MIIKDNICQICGGKCCKGEISGFDPCKWLTPTGCNLCEEHRSPTCCLWPFVIIDDRRFIKSRRIFLDTGCLYWEHFAKHFKDLPVEEDKKDYSLVICRLSIEDIEGRDPRMIDKDGGVVPKDGMITIEDTGHEPNFEVK